jgi:hypothetical protein
MRTIFGAVLVVLCVVSNAWADNKFHKVPGKAAENLQLRVVKYDGSTNGVLTVSVKNTGKQPVQFSAKGLYFVPDGDPDKSPQRLGAVGPMEIARGESSVRKEALTIPAGKTVQVALDVFCIDSHRSSPTSETPFTIAKTRMPQSLTRTIDVRAKAAAGKHKYDYAAPAAKADIQSEVWRTRDSAWVDLDGEGAQEASK